VSFFLSWRTPSPCSPFPFPSSKLDRSDHVTRRIKGMSWSQNKVFFLQVWLSNFGIKEMSKRKSKLFTLGRVNFTGRRRHVECKKIRKRGNLPTFLANRKNVFFFKVLPLQFTSVQFKTERWTLNPCLNLNYLIWNPISFIFLLTTFVGCINLNNKFRIVTFQSKSTESLSDDG